MNWEVPLFNSLKVRTKKDNKKMKQMPSIQRIPSSENDDKDLGA
jgi:hypothetical protein